MAIIFNIDRAIADSQFNVLGLSIPMLLENQVEEFERGSKISKLFVNKQLSGYSQSYHTSVSHGGFRPAEDMDVAKLHDWEDSYGITFTAQTWMDSFAISQGLRHLSSLLIPYQAMEQHCMEGQLAGLLQRRKYHSDYPEENDIITRYQYICWEEIIHLLRLLRPAKR